MLRCTISLQSDSAMLRLILLGYPSFLFGCTSFLLGCASWLLILPYANASVPEERLPLVWVYTSAPPFYITAGPMKGRGFSDQALRMLQEELPEFDHVMQMMPIRRLFQFWKEDANLCLMTMVQHPERRDVDYILSTPYVFYHPHAVIIKTDNPRVSALRQKAAHTTVSVEHFFAARNLLFGTMADRPLGRRLDPVYELHRAHMHIIERGDTHSLNGLFNMLKLGRVDYLIDYPFVFRFYDQQPEYQGLFDLVPVTENRDALIWASVGCTNNEWGKTVIAAINRAIVRLAQRDDYRQLVVQWHAEKGKEAEYWHMLSSVIAETTATEIPTKDAPARASGQP